MDVVLIAGLWLEGSAWREVASALENMGHRPIPVTLPGHGDGAPTASLEDQLSAVLSAVDATSSPPLVVGHSAAATLAWLAADARPDRVRGVCLVGGFPASDGEQYAAGFDVVDGVIPFPGWEPFEGPDAADLDENMRQQFVSSSVPVPEAVAKGLVRLTEPRRFTVPVVLVCPEFSPAQAREWIEDGEVPELAMAEHLSMVNIDSGHWPMFTRPEELARVLADCGDR